MHLIWRRKNWRKDPVLTIYLKEIEAEIGTNGLRKSVDKVTEYFNPGKGNSSFQPSGIEVHPKTGHIYVLAHVGKLLVVLNRRGKILHIAKLKSKHLDQPEGITFAPDGTMYISSEAAGGKTQAPRIRLPMKPQLLIIGGTNFIGRNLVETLLTQNEYAFTLLNRGRTNPGLFPDVPRIPGRPQ